MKRSADVVASEEVRFRTAKKAAPRQSVTALQRLRARPGRDLVTSEDKLAARVARRIEDDIIRAGWPVDTVFGSEKALLARYEVSRAVLREAIGIVEHHQVAAMRRGAGGGLVVRKPDASSAAVALFVYLEYARATVDDIVEARLVLEPLASELAAHQIDEDGIARLRGVVRRERTSQPAVLSDARHQLHVAIAELSGNPALRLFVETLTRLTSQYAASPLRSPKTDVASVMEASSAAHSAIAEAVIAGDAALAAYRATRHLNALRGFLAHGNGVRRTTTPRGLDRVGGRAPRSKRKLAETLAFRIQREVVRRGWPVGEVLGSETDLLRRYGVSRAVLRAAVRLLEHHSIATMRRGPGGGLVVMAPQPGPVIEAVALYLEYERIDLEQLYAVREAVELGCVDLAMARLNEEGAQRLRDSIELVRSDRSRLSVLSQTFHDEIAELTGNPILAVFERVLTTLVAYHTTKAPAGLGVTDDGDPLAAVLQVHGRILQAMVAGDRGLARHRMSQHLRGLTHWYQ